MPLCGPSCAIPSCESVPVVGFGSGGCDGFGRGYGFGYGSGYGSGFGGSVSAESLGVLHGAHVACINQIPPCEVVIQPPACVLTIPGPILSATCDPVAVGGYAPCADGGFGFGGHGFGRTAVGSRYGLLGGRGLSCSPCN